MMDIPSPMVPCSDMSTDENGSMDASSAANSIDDVSDNPTPKPKPSSLKSHSTRLPLSFLVLAVAVIAAVSFCLGRTARSHLLSLDHEKTGRIGSLIISLSNIVKSTQSLASNPKSRMEDTTTTTTTTTSSSSSSSDDNRVCPNASINETTEQWKSRNLSDNNDDGYQPEDGENDTDSGWHLFMELQGVKTSLLETMERMEENLLDLIDEMEDFEDPLHYYCHQGSPRRRHDQHRSGSTVTCVGVSSNRNHVWMHSWPEDGIVSVDVFAAGEDGLRQLIPEAEDIFGVKGNVVINGDESMRWKQKHRGLYKSLEESDIAGMQDMYLWPVGMTVDYKVEVAAVQTMFQEIRVWDVLVPFLGSVESYKRSLTGDGSYEATHPELFRPDRIVFLDGLLQSRRSGDAAYHEALVHPTLLAHENPKRVAIIGGGEGATLREVLKHSTIDKVVMIEIDEMMVNASRMYLPEWNDCSDITGRADNCFDDPHTELHCEDAFAWFKDRFSEKDKIQPEDQFDIVIMDALDPQSMQEIVGALYTDNAFYHALNNALRPDGAIVAQIGDGNTILDPPSMFSEDRNCDGFVDGLEALNFTEMTEYQEGGCGFFSPWSFHVATKDKSTLLTKEWFANEALIDVKIRKRILPTVDGQSSLHYFDGATMQTYRYPSKASEVVFCLDPILPESCLEGNGFNSEFENTPASKLNSGPGGIYSESNVPLDSFVGLETMVQSIHIDAAAGNILSKTCEMDSVCLSQPILAYQKEFGMKIANGAALPSNPLLKTNISSPCLETNITILESLGKNEEGKPLYSVLAPPFPAMPTNDTFLGHNSSTWSDYDLARRRETPFYPTIQRTKQSVAQGSPMTKETFCSLTRQHYA